MNCRQERIRLLAEHMRNKSAAFLYVQNALSVDKDCGHNLDALWDVLSERDRLCAELSGGELLRNTESEGYLELFEDLAREGFDVIITEAGHTCAQEKLWLLPLILPSEYVD